MAKKIYDENGNEVKVKVEEKKRGGCLKWAGIIILVIILVGACSAMFGGNEESSTNQQTEEATTTANQEQSGDTEAEAEETTETEADVPQEYKNALNKAESYATTMHMSEQRVYDQLTSEYGENFPEEAAQYAMDNLEGIDWNENALEKAKSYYENQSMSKDRVYDQLVSEHGEAFTEEQAQYAVDNLE